MDTGYLALLGAGGAGHTPRSSWGGHVKPVHGPLTLALSLILLAVTTAAQALAQGTQGTWARPGGAELDPCGALAPWPCPQEAPHAAGSHTIAHILCPLSASWPPALIISPKRS